MAVNRSKKSGKTFANTARVLKLNFNYYSTIKSASAAIQAATAVDEIHLLANVCRVDRSRKVL